MKRAIASLCAMTLLSIGCDKKEDSTEQVERLEGELAQHINEAQIYQQKLKTCAHPILSK